VNRGGFEPSQSGNITRKSLFFLLEAYLAEKLVRGKQMRATRYNLIMAMGRLVRSTASFGDVTPPFMPVFDAISTQEHFIRAVADGARA
jgi:hypothetical protein